MSGLRTHRIALQVTNCRGQVKGKAVGDGKETSNIEHRTSNKSRNEATKTAQRTKQNKTNRSVGFVGRKFATEDIGQSEKNRLLAAGADGGDFQLCAGEFGDGFEIGACLGRKVIPFLGFVRGREPAGKFGIN